MTLKIHTPQPRTLSEFTAGEWFRNEETGKVYLVVRNHGDSELDFIDLERGAIMGRTSSHHSELEASMNLYPVDVCISVTIPASKDLGQ